MSFDLYPEEGQAIIDSTPTVSVLPTDTFADIIVTAAPYIIMTGAMALFTLYVYRNRPLKTLTGGLNTWYKRLAFLLLLPTATAFFVALIALVADPFVDDPSDFFDAISNAFLDRGAWHSDWSAILVGRLAPPVALLYLIAFHYEATLGRIVAWVVHGGKHGRIGNITQSKRRE